jgi:type I restriction-modification system DNA methylase subunit
MPTELIFPSRVNGEQCPGIEDKEVFYSNRCGTIMADDFAIEICEVISALQKSSDSEVFVKKLLRDTLNWPIDLDDIEKFDFDELGYDWNTELEEMGLRSEEGITDLFQIAKFPGWPVGMFILKFGSNSIFTKGRGMTTPLRNLLRHLVEKVRPTANHQTWSQDQLLFMCHHEHRYFQFARFTNVEGYKLPKLQTFGWGPNDHIRTLCEFNLRHLAYDSSMSPEDSIEQINKAFDVQKVTKKFYEDYKHTFSQFKSNFLEHCEENNSDEIHRHIQLIFNRFLFLRFIEKKKWMNYGEGPNYLQNLLNASQEKSSLFYKSHFLPMALDGLSKIGKQKDEAYGEVPLIGGGLFEEAILDKKYDSIPNDLFEPIIGENGLLYRYNFTVQESTPLNIQVAIDPEMIGTMFEELVTDRDGKGAFYTPRIVVSYMCKEGIKSILAEKTGVSIEKLNQLIDDQNADNISVPEAKKIRKELDGLKVIDPACGSGAYLVGLLQVVLKIHEDLQTLSEEFNRTKYELKLHIISQSIFGVDIDPFATQIAMLRLWLTLAVESDNPVRLPNLDFNIETGDALLSPNPGVVDWFSTDLIKQADELGELKRGYIFEAENIPQLRAKIKATESRISKLLRKNQYVETSVDFRVQFANVFSKNKGFDLVLANPPYVKHQDLDSKFKNLLKKTYGSESHIKLKATSDLYCYFYIRANQLLRNGGLQFFICSNTWLDAGFGIRLQEIMLQNSSILKIIDSAVERQFQSADVNTIISVIQKIEPNAESIVEFIYLLDSFGTAVYDASQQKIRCINQRKIYSDGLDDKGELYLGRKLSSYMRAPDIYWKIFEKYSDKFVKLSDVALQKTGVKTGCDGFFILNQARQAEWNIEEQFLLPLFRSSTECMEVYLDKKMLQTVLFYCNIPRGRLQGTNALKYIEWGEEQGYHQWAKPKTQRLWYGVGELSPAPIVCPRSMNEIFRTFMNKAEVVSNFRLSNIYPKGDFALELCAILNSTLTSLMVELGARTGLGQGLVDMMAYELDQIPIVNPDLVKGLMPLNRKIGSLEFEIKAADRLEMDKVIFDSIGLTKLERVEIYDGFKLLVNNRLGRSENIT